MTPELSNKPIQAELAKCVDQVTALRDEVRLQVHLAGMDANRAVADVSAELEAIGRTIATASEASRVALLERLRRVEEALADIARTLPGAV
jgi:hypothetical protein